MLRDEEGEKHFFDWFWREARSDRVAYLAFSLPVGFDISEPGMTMDSCLRISKNAKTGFAALTWTPFGDRALDPKREADQDIWVSNNPEGPPCDPKVIAAPAVPLLHHPKSVLPVISVRNAVNEYVATGTGDRPEEIDWVPGGMNGIRYDVGDYGPWREYLAE